MTDCQLTLLIPAEILHEIALYLPRHILKSLMIFQPHPLGKIASYVYFSTLSSLHLGVIGMSTQCTIREPPEHHDKLVTWHNKRSLNILKTIMDSEFGKRIQKLIIYSACSAKPGNHPEVLASQRGVPIAYRPFILPIPC